MATSVQILLAAVISSVIFNSQLTSSVSTGDPILIGKLAIGLLYQCPIIIGYCTIESCSACKFCLYYASSLVPRRPRSLIPRPSGDEATSLSCSHGQIIITSPWAHWQPLSDFLDMISTRGIP